MIITIKEYKKYLINENLDHSMLPKEITDTIYNYCKKRNINIELIREERGEDYFQFENNEISWMVAYKISEYLDEKDIPNSGAFAEDEDNDPHIKIYLDDTHS